MAHPNTHDSLKKNIGGTVVSVALNKSGNKALGPLVAPAVWLYDYQKYGKPPGSIDIGMYASSFFNAPAAFVASIVKSTVDDEIETKLKHVRSKEPKLYRDYIAACYNYASSPSNINAMTIANKGGTAWHHPIGIWVYITDANGHFVADYKPVNPTVVYRPDLPLKKHLNGGYKWDTHRK